MKQLFYIFLCSLVVFASCKKDVDPTPSSIVVKVQLVYPAGSELEASAGVKVTATNTTQTFEATTDAQGVAQFELPFSIYQFTASDTHAENGRVTILNGNLTGITVNAQFNSTNIVELNLLESKLSQLIIKELYNGGFNKPDNSAYVFDRYVILYNNSDFPASLNNVCLTGTYPFNAPGVNKYYDESGKLVYENDTWIPAGMGFWYLTSEKTLQPGEQIVISCGAAVDHTATFSNSVDLSKPNYYVMYDIDNWNSATYYPSPSSNIPTTQYLKSAKFSQGNAWTYSVSSPGFFIFATDGVTPTQFGNDATSVANYPESTTQFIKKIPKAWILDGVDAFLMDETSNKKRLTADIDAGNVYHINRKGYTLYRNVDKTATEAIAENEGKLVYNYSKGTDDLTQGSTDPSGIDAEASIKNGARIIYKDTNNSTADFHLRREASLRD